MYIIRLLVVLILFALPAHAADYYFDATSGSDTTGDGSPGSPYKTLATLDTLTLNGDSVYLKRGETWYESTTPNITGPVTFDAYGDDNLPLPVISGEEIYTASGWIQSGNEYYRTPSGEPYAVWKNGTTQLNCSTLDTRKSDWSASGGGYRYGLHDAGSPVTMTKAIFEDLSEMTENAAACTTCSDICTGCTETCVACTETCTACTAVCNDACSADCINCTDNYNSCRGACYQTCGSGSECLACDQCRPALDTGEWCQNWNSLYVRLSDDGDPGNKEDFYLKIMTTNAGSLNEDSCFYDKGNNRLYVRLLNNEDPGNGQSIISSSVRNGMTIIDDSDVTIKNIKFDKQQLHSVFYDATTSQSNINIDGIESHYAGRSGIVFRVPEGNQVTGILIQNYRIENFARTNYFITETAQAGIDLGSFISKGYSKGSFSGSIKNGLITLSDDYQAITPDYRNGIMLSKPNGFIIEDNEISYTGAGLYFNPPHSDYSGFDSNFTIRNNYIHHISKHGMRLQFMTGAVPNEIHNNIVAFAGYNSLVGRSCLGSANADIYNNTCINPYYKGIAAGDGSTARNNIIQIAANNTNYQMAQMNGVSTGIFSNNIYYDSVGECADLFSAGGDDYDFAGWLGITETVPYSSIDSDPLLVSVEDNDFHPLLGGPACNMSDTGSYVGALPCISVWHNNRAYRQAITISSSMTSAAVSDFPVLVKITDQSNPVFDNARADGADIVFAGPDGVPLDYEIELYRNSGTKELDAWVRMPQLSPTEDMIIFMYYGNSSAVSQENSEGVWDGNHVMVQHLSEQAGQHYDSTLNNNDSNEVSVIGQGVPCGIGGCDEFEADNYVNIPDAGVDSPLDLSGSGSITLSAWVYAAGPGEYPGNQSGIITKKTGGTIGYTLRIDGHNCSGFGDYTVMGSYPGNWSPVCFDATPNNVRQGGQAGWYHVAYVYDSASFDHYLYVDGVKDAEGNNGILSNVDSVSDLRIGEWGGGSFDGFIDEVRLSNSARSQTWINASYKNQSSPDSYTTLGAEETAPWYESSWPYRQEITIGSGMTTEELSDFPVLVKIMGQNNPLFDTARSDGADIVFTGADGALLDFEVELYRNSGTKELDAWVRVPLLSPSEDTIIYMYYGNSVAVSQANPAGVWDSGHLMVQHLNETSGQHMDSTANNNDSNSVSVSSQGQTATAKIGGADEFGADTYVSIPDAGVDSQLDLSGGGSITLSAWVYATGIGEYPGNQQGIMAKGPHGGSRGYNLRLDGHNCSGFGDYTVMGSRAGNWSGICGAANNVVPNGWDHVVYVYDSSTLDHYLYMNGVLDRTGNLSATANDSANDLRIGEWGGGSFDGFIDEVRISNMARSEAWIKASYRNQNDHDNYLTSGGLEVQ